ncbi:MAG TPA: hypothetical protein VK421_10495 [Pyrinomonadaceae bacterium]|nr:hypothetical protein [Pyrinomonadaceae bacterium]
MSHTRMQKLAGLALACLFVVGAQTLAAAQGRGRGGGNPNAGNPGAGNPGRGGNPGSIGRPEGVGVDRGIGTSSDRSGGRADRGRATASERSNGRSDAGLERARLMRENGRRADEELRERPGVAEHLGTPPGRLRDEYESALATNPDLKFGQFVAANVLARNLGSRNPAITTDALLAGLRSGDSIGRTLQNLGLSSREAKDAERQAKREVEQARRRRS